MPARIDNSYSSMGDKLGQVVRTGDGFVLSATVINTAISDRFFQLFDRTTLPTTGDKPVYSVPVYRDNGYTEVTRALIGVNGLAFGVGICWVMSTSAATYQPGAITDAVVNIVWV